MSRLPLSLAALSLFFLLASSALAPPFPLSADQSVAADAAQQLTGAAGASWFVSSTVWKIAVPATVPGDLLTDLQRAGVIGDPWRELNFLNTTTPGAQGAPIWDVGQWEYAASVTPDAAVAAALAAGGTATLVFDGVKMAADVLWNGAPLGCVNDQFLRFSFDVNVLPGANDLRVNFSTSRDERNKEGRFSGASGGWDWGALTATDIGVPSVGNGNMHTFSKGLWRDVWLTVTLPGSAAISHAAPLIFYDGAYPQSPLTRASAGPWTVSVRTQLRVPTGGVRGAVTVTGAWGGAGGDSGPLVLLAGDALVIVNMTVPAGAVDLWWPNGLGVQQMYDVLTTFTPNTGAAVSTTRRVGFRTVVVVTADDTNPASIAGVDGSGDLLVRWKVNGANLNLRGADVIPMENLEGRQSDVSYVGMLASAAAANFNVIRVDGIDLYFPDIFYSTCDALGLLVYHDMQYSQGNVYPSNSTLQKDEIVHTLRRLAHHPALAVYDGCNECGGHGIYASFVLTTVAQEDPSRPPWPASPSNGWVSGVDRLTSLPNGSPLGLQPTVKIGGEYAGDRRRRALLKAAGTATPSSTCQFVPNRDICPGTPECLAMPHPPAATPDACCALCAAAGADACGASVFFNGVCWFKPLNATVVAAASSDAILCWPTSRGPVPVVPTPTPGPMPPTTSRERHGAYTHGTGFPAVNGDPNLSPFDPNVPPAFDFPYEVSPTAPGFLVSEFGISTASSFESMAPTLDPSHWSLHGGAPADKCVGGFFRNCTGASGQPENVMAQRNYPQDSIIASYFGMGVVPSLGDVGEIAFKRQLYFAMIACALQQKAHIEALRSAPSWGTIIWQLAEVWPTAGWGSLEYGVVDSSLTGGQVAGGRWKPLHHMLEKVLFRDILIACSASAACYVRNDAPLTSVLGNITLQAVSIETGAPVGPLLSTVPVALAPGGSGASSVSWFCMDAAEAPSIGCNSRAEILASVGCAGNGSDCAVVATLRDANDTTIVAQNFLFQAPPSSLLLARGVSVTAAVGTPNADGSVPVTVTVVGGAAVHVLLSTLAQGRFTENAWPLLPVGSHETTFVSIVPAGYGGPSINVTLLNESIRIDHVDMYV